LAHEANNPVNFAINAARALDLSIRDLAQLSEQMGQLDWSCQDRLMEQLAELERLQDELGAADLSATAAELVEIVIDGLERTARLVGELRDFAKPGEGKRTSIDLAEGLEATLKLVAPTLVANDVDVDLQVSEEVPVIQGDSGALNQVFLNLIKNAAEAMEGQGGSIVVSLTEAAGEVCVVVADDGPGIAPEVQQRLFEPFYTTKGAGQGTGLGLSICRQIAEAHGGSLGFESTLGSGATFRLRIPFEERRQGL
jgi:two-component system NtrC family sensor kinase